MRFLVLCGLFCAVATLPTQPLPNTMNAATAVQGASPCEKPDWSCISDKSVPVPKIAPNQLLLKMAGSSVNPVNVDLVEPSCRAMSPPFGCSNGTIGNDGAGTVVELGSECKGFAVNDQVFGLLEGAYAQYSVANCNSVALKPRSIGLADAGTIPVVGGTSLQCLQAAGLPSKASNLTVVVTAGQGGTGFIAVQLAKALGATKVVTAATGEGIALMQQLGADQVVDYHNQELSDVLPDNSVDIVFDNLGVPGTADKMMHAIRPGGTFLVLLGGNGGTVSKHPKQGVKQVSFGISTAGKPELEQLQVLFDEGKLKPHTMASYSIEQVPEAFTRLRSSGVLGKISILIN